MERLTGLPWSRERIVAAAVLGGLLLTAVGLWVFAVVSAEDAPSAVQSGQPPAAEAERNEHTSPEAEGPSAEERPDTPDERDARDEVTVVELDGMCVAEVDPSQVGDPDTVRAWELPECEHAPVDPSDGPWIVVVASLNGNEVAESEARARTRTNGASHDLLWSSHYPSLTPDLWVVFEGPFPDQEAATAAAERLGGGSYTRLLSDDRVGR